MSRIASPLLALVAACAFVSGLARAEPGAPGAPGSPGSPGSMVRRLALVAGANDGGPSRARLRYAVADAEGVARVLQQMGGVAAPDALLLVDPPGAAALRAAMGVLNERVARARRLGPVEVVFYYSGHSDEEGLLLRGDRLPYAELRAWLGALGADVRIAVLDSCASGALTRAKGGARVAPFLLDAANRVTGHAILTSSAADEASQESDRLGASFFTSALLTGLRGGADVDRDGRVTLSEAYQFAYEETLARTERTRSGAQHPAWDIQLAGSGEVVLTDLRGTGAALALPPAVSGRYFVRDGGGRLVAELRKPAGRAVELGLDPGSYTVVREAGGRLDEVTVELRPGPATPLPAVGFAAVSRELGVLRGDGAEPVEHRFADLAIFPPISRNGDRPAVNRLQFGLIGSRTTRLDWGLGAAPVLWAEEDVSGLYLAYIGSSARGSVRGAQLAGVANVAGALDGLQVSGVLNLARSDVRGAQLSASVNWTDGTLVGAQEGLTNYAGHALGLQAGVVSVARRLDGVQLGLVNVAREGSAYQVGLVNVAGRLSGLQLGLVNVADQVEGVPIGLVSLVRDGEHKVLLLADEAGTPGAELLLGTHRVHGLLRVAAQRTGAERRAWLGWGLGAHLARGALLLDVDALADAAVGVESDHVRATVRALAGWQLTSWLAVVGGPSASAFWSERGFDPEFGGVARGKLGSGRRWIGFQAGLRIGP